MTTPQPTSGIFCVLAISLFSFACKLKDQSSLASVTAIAADGGICAFDQGAVDSAIAIGQRVLTHKIGALDYYPESAYIDQYFVSQYVFMQKYFEYSSPHFDAKKFKRQLLATQRSDGSWDRERDKMQLAGQIDATIFNYAALKIMGEDKAAPHMTRAAAWVRQHGYLTQADLFNQVLLALTGNVNWKSIPYVPSLIFNKNVPDLREQMPQWVFPHVLPIAYLNEFQLVRFIDGAHDLRELRDPNDEYVPHLVDRQKLARSPTTEGVIDKLLESQQPRGSWSATTTATMLSTVALFDFLGRRPDYVHSALIRTEINRGLAYLDNRYFQGPSAYRGSFGDSRYWDSAMTLMALLATGYDDQTVIARLAHMLLANFTGSGFPFGEDLHYAPDNDSTGAVVKALLMAGSKDPKLTTAINWLLGRQNTDSGWASFAKNNNESSLIRWAAGDMSEETDLFDNSSADVTGRLLDTFASAGMRVGNPKVDSAVAFLKTKFESQIGAWPGRWSINYLAGTSSVIEGLTAVGVPPSDEQLVAAVNWVARHQNEDGGFGESPRSYREKDYAGVGGSTASQTAFAINILLRGLTTAPAQGELVVQKAVDYLLKNLRTNGHWVDPYTIGTGHEGIMYIEYPFAPDVYPLLALAEFKKYTARRCKSP